MKSLTRTLLALAPSLPHVLELRYPRRRSFPRPDAERGALRQSSPLEPRSMSTARTLRSLALVTLFSATPALAQEIHGELIGPTQFEMFGSATVSMGDIDGDAVPDFVTSAPAAGNTGSAYGRVEAWSGASLASLWNRWGFVDKGDFGQSLANVGDIDGDGVNDVLVGAPDLVSGGGHDSVTAGYAQTFSGVDGTLIQHFDGDSVDDMFGSAVASLGDITGDGVGDFAVGAAGDDDGGLQAGSVRRFNGATGAVLSTQHGTQAGAGFGGRLVGPVDLDGNGVKELLVGALSHDGNGVDSGAVFLVPAAGGSALHTWFGPQAGAAFGGAIAAIGDTDFDGKSEVAIGAHDADGETISSGAVFVYSGASKSLLFSYTGWGLLMTYAGRSIAPTGDLDGDGRADLLIGVSASSFQGSSSGHVSVLSGLDGSELGRAYGANAEQLGTAATALGDLDGDGKGEIGVFAIFGQRGQLKIFSLEYPLPPSTYCTAKLNSQGCFPVLSAQGSPTASGADDLVLVANQTINQKAGLFIHSFKPGVIHTFPGTICLGAPISRSPGSSTGGNAGPDDCSGVLSFHLSHAYMASQGMVPGSLVHAQAWFRDFAAPLNQFGLSQGLAFVIAP
jgi:hypothetical protein